MIGDQRQQTVLRWLDRGALGALVAIGLAIVGFSVSVYSRLGIVETEVRNVNTSMIVGQEATEASLKAIQQDIRDLRQQGIGQSSNER